MKTLKFAPDLVLKILAGEKTSTWRLFDDKDLIKGNELLFLNKETSEPFGTAVITTLTTRTLGTLTNEDWVGHEKFASEEEMYATYRKYYGDEVDKDSEVKILAFEFTKLREWNFGKNVSLANKLKGLVLSGKKIATTGLYTEGKVLPKAGEYAAIVGSDNKRFCIIQYTKVEVKPFLEVGYDYITLEGEGDKDTEEWRKKHRKFFTENYGEFKDGSQVVCEEFKVVEVVE